MIDPREQQLKEMLDVWLNEKKKATEMVRHFREALAILKGTKQSIKKLKPVSTGGGSREIIFSLLKKSQSFLTEIQIHQMLGEAGSPYSRQIINIRLRELVESGEVERVSAKGSASRWKYGVSGAVEETNQPEKHNNEPGEQREVFD